MPASAKRSGSALRSRTSVDGRADAGDRRRPVDDRVADGEPVAVGDAHLARQARGLREHAGRDASGVDAGAAGALGFDDGDTRAEFGGAKGGGGAGRAGSDHEDVVVVGCDSGHTPNDYAVGLMPSECPRGTAGQPTVPHSPQNQVGSSWIEWKSSGSWQKSHSGQVNSWSMCGVHHAAAALRAFVVVGHLPDGTPPIRAAAVPRSGAPRPGHTAERSGCQSTPGRGACVSR